MIAADDMDRFKNRICQRRQTPARMTDSAARAIAPATIANPIEKRIQVGAHGRTDRNLYGPRTCEQLGKIVAPTMSLITRQPPPARAPRLKIRRRHIGAMRIIQALRYNCIVRTSISMPPPEIQRTRLQGSVQLR